MWKDQWHNFLTLHIILDTVFSDFPPLERKELHRKTKKIFIPSKDHERYITNLRSKITQPSASSIKEKWEIRRVIIWNICWLEGSKISKVKPIPGSDKHILTLDITYTTEKNFRRKNVLLKMTLHNNGPSIYWTHHDKFLFHGTVSKQEVTANPTGWKWLSIWIVNQKNYRARARTHPHTWNANHFFSTRLRKGRVLRRSCRLLKKYCLKR